MQVANYSTVQVFATNSHSLLFPEPRIVQQPQNQYILDGTSAIITCITRGDAEPYWIVSEIALALPLHQDDKSRLESMGVVFYQSNNSTTHNLTMIVPAYLWKLVYNVHCVVLSDLITRQTVESDIVNISVFTILRKCVTIMIGYLFRNSIRVVIHQHDYHRWNNCN